jgi:signal transduction histidine kinase
MRLADRLTPRSITAQITCIVTLSVVVGLVLVMTIVLFFLEGNPRYGLTAMAAQIGTVSRLARAAKSDGELTAIIAVARDTGVQVKRAALGEIKVAQDGCCLSTEASLLARRLESRWGVDVLEVVASPGGASGQLAVKLNERDVLVFDGMYGLSLWTIVVAPTVLALVIVLLFVVLLSIYAVRWIISPLSALAAAAQSFGRSPEDNKILRRRGPREIVQVADALNEMRTRIRGLLDDRTRMLTAISHDLRTPLTRLRLRAERVADPALREGQLHEITRITHMLDETLGYLRRDARSEPVSRVDLPSLLQTICAEFADVGHTVTYEGPPHLTWTCRPGVLARAISNIVDNAVKHGAIVTVVLCPGDDGAVAIDVGDDGPGIPAALREKVFDPFFKGDTARGADGRSGFGLGLSIARDVVNGHGGGIELLERKPRGLMVRIRLPGIAAADRGNIS